MVSLETMLLASGQVYIDQAYQSLLVLRLYGLGDLAHREDQSGQAAD